MRRVFRRIGRIIVSLLLLIVVILGVLYFIYNEKLPEGKSGKEADLLAQKMLIAVNYDSYKNTRYLEWSFNGGKHQYKWDKINGRIHVQWDDYKVILSQQNIAKTDVWKEGVEIFGKEKQELIKKATDLFNNDSFWLVAPFKVFDKGTVRSIVKFVDGSQGLLVTYSSGGTTPGDSYLWKLQSNGFPESYQMWTSIIPLGGIEATWEDWQIMDSGAFLPTSHKIGPMTLFMGEVKAYN